MNRYEAEFRNMRHCYWVALLKNILLVILIIISIYLTGTAWCLLALAVMSSCKYDDFLKENEDE